MTSNSAYISLGSNIRPAHYLPAAVQALAGFGKVISVSHVWESNPVGDINQNNFLNAAVLLETEQQARELKNRTLKKIENLLDRRRDPSNKNAARTIDLDLSLFNHEVFQLENRAIPDPEILERPFVALPLSELDPEYIHPTEKCPLQEIAKRFNLNEWGMNLTSDIVLNAKQD